MAENQSSKPRQYYTVQEVANLLEWTEDHVWEALETGELAAIALAHWAEPEIFDYRYATPEVVKAIRGANVEEVIWECRGPLGPARFPANPANIRLLAEYVDALKLNSSSPSTRKSAAQDNSAWNKPMKRKAIVDVLGRRFPKLESALHRGEEWVKECQVPGKTGWYFLDALEAECHSRYGGKWDSNTEAPGVDFSLAGQVREINK